MGRPRPAVGGSHSHSLGSVPSPGPGKENDYALESLDGYIVWCCWELKRKFRLKFFTTGFTRTGRVSCPVQSHCLLSVAPAAPVRPTKGSSYCIDRKSTRLN